MSQNEEFAAQLSEFVGAQRNGYAMHAPRKTSMPPSANRPISLRIYNSNIAMGLDQSDSICFSRPGDAKSLFRFPVAHFAISGVTTKNALLDQTAEHMHSFFAEIIAVGPERKL